MSYTKGDNRNLIISRARENGWTVTELDYHNILLRRGDTDISLVWTTRDTLAYAGISLSNQGRYPAQPADRFAKTLAWITAPGEQAS
jgi:hypothetical protein